jgi:RHH-type rel operon transcriptional repressor/antitoxin RelB
MTTHAIPLEPDLWARLEELAASAGRSASELAAAVLRDFLEENARHLDAIDAGIAEADAGELVGLDEVKAGVERRLAALSARR